MGAHYCIGFEIDIDPQKETFLTKQMDYIGLRGSTDYWFEREEKQSRTILCVRFNEHTSYTMISEIESFITNYLEPAARSTVLVTEECDGDRNIYAIGPDREEVESDYHCGEARKHLKTCNISHQKIIHEWLDDKLTP